MHSVSLIVITSEAASAGIHIAYALVEKHSEAYGENCLEDTIEEVVEKARRTRDPEGLKNDPVVRAYRSFYWRVVEIDPTKVRPSSEALARRLLRGGRLPRIHPLVDAGNLASLLTLVSIGVYDLEKAQPPLVISFSRGGELFRPIGGSPEILPANVPILVDGRGVVMHLYPHRDSVDTMVGESTRRALIIAAGVAGVSRELLVEAVMMVLRFAEKCGWYRSSGVYVLP